MQLRQHPLRHTVRHGSRHITAERFLLLPPVVSGRIGEATRPNEPNRCRAGSDPPVLPTPFGTRVPPSSHSWLHVRWGSLPAELIPAGRLGSRPDHRRAAFPLPLSAGKRGRLDKRLPVGGLAPGFSGRLTGDPVRDVAEAPHDRLHDMLELDASRKMDRNEVRRDQHLWP